MARTSIVIGLGGTGQWVLTYLKKDLMESNNGIMPANVQLLAVDTQSPDVEMRIAGANFGYDPRMSNLTDAQVGTVRLDRISEFFQIGEPLYDFVFNIHRQNPKLEEFRWLDTDFLINAGPNFCNTVYGAGAYRQLGRLSLFNKVEPFYDKLKQLIFRGMKAIQFPAPNPLEIVIVNSLAGGTGAGTFLDVAWLVRAAARQLNFAFYQLTGYFVMPTAWEQAGISIDKRLRSYAAWQELNRFMLPPIDHNDSSEILYNLDANPPIKGIYDRRVFDTAYIIDPDRLGSSLRHLRPEDATYPVVAEAISALLDDTLGQMISHNHADISAMPGWLPRAAYYNTLGAFTFKTPEHFSKLQIRNEYRMAVLEQLIAPEFGPSGEAICVRQDKNIEAVPLTVEHGAKVFLSSADHNNLNNNLLLPDIQEVSSKGDDLNRYVLEESKRIVNRSGATFKALTNKVNDLDLQPKLDKLVNENIWHVVIPSGDRKNATPRDIKQEVLNGVEAKDVEWFGQWGYIADPRNPAIQIQTRITEGSKVRTLRDAGNALLRNFKVLLKEWSANQLNGIDSDPIKAKSGKLGYVLGVYDELDRKFAAYLGYLNLLKERISDNGTRVKLTDARDAARKRYDMLAGKECIFAFFDNNVHPHARDAERNFLRATNNLFQYYLSESIINVLAETVRSMQSFTLESRKKLNAWVMVLAVGKPEEHPDTRFTSLYNYSWGTVRAGMNGFHEEVRRENPSFETNGELRGVQQMLNLKAADTHYQANDRIAALTQGNQQTIPYLPNEEIRNGLDAFTWSVGQAAGGVSLEFGLGIRDENGNSAPLLSAQTNDAIMQNYSKLNQVLNHQFDKVMTFNFCDDLGTPIIQILSKTFQDTQDFARKLKQYSKPLYRKREGAETIFQRNKMFMRLDGSTNYEYFTALENSVEQQLVGAMESINHYANHGMCSTTSDPYKFTFLQYHHLIPSTEFALLGDLERLFQDTTDQPNQIVSPNIHYAFNAERKAHELAVLKTKQNNENFKSFDPELVVLLEDPERTKLFFLAYAQGLLVYQEGRKNANTTLVLHGKDDMNDIYLYDRDESSLWSGMELTIYEAIHYWLIGKDDRPHMGNINRIDWHKLHEIIQTVEMGQGENDIIAAYYKQMDENDPESLVSLIRSQADERRTAFHETNQHFYQDELFNNLIDLAKVFYTERIQSLEKNQKNQEQ